MEQDWKNKVINLSKETCKIIEQYLTDVKFEQFDFIYESDHGLILKAFSKEHQSQVALKISKNTKKYFEQQQREYEIIKSIKGSSNIVNIYDMIQIENTFIFIIVLELCQKSFYDEMQELITAKKWFTDEEMTSIIIQIAHSLTQIHCYGIIHSDIKPQNILKSFDGTYKLCDFGLSEQILHQNSAQQAKTYGQMLKYQSLEQQKKYEKHKGQDVVNQIEKSEIIITCSSDVYSAGLVFLEILGYNLTNQDAYNISHNIYENLVNIQSFRYPKILEILRNQFFLSNPKLRIGSYEILNTLLPELPFTQNNLIKLIPLIQHVEKQDTFDNSKHISFILNIQHYYQLTLLFIYQIVPNASVKEMANTYSSIAWILTEQGQYVKSNQYREKALTLYQQLKPTHSENIIFELQQICYNFKNMKQIKNSLKYGKKALKLAMKAYKGNNEHVARSMIELAWCYRCKGQDKKGLELAQKAYNMYCQLYGITFHKDIGDALSAIGSMNSGLKKYEESIDTYKKAIHVYQKVYNYQEHPDIAICLENTGLAYEYLKEYNISLLYYEDCVNMKKQIFGNASVRISSTLQKLLRIQRILGQQRQAIQTEKELQEIQNVPNQYLK